MRKFTDDELKRAYEAILGELWEDGWEIGDDLRLVAEAETDEGAAKILDEWGWCDSLECAKELRRALGIAPDEYVRVRICVAVDDVGRWASSGYGGGSGGPTDADMCECALEGLGDPAPDQNVAYVWITACVPVPKSVEVQGEVETEEKN